MDHDVSVKAEIKLRGVRVHNLKGIDLDLPLNRLIAITGVSGAGKSSLAFDTLYAEGQRRYIGTFSAYTRQFLEKLDKPDADVIEGLPPAVAVTSSRSRSDTLTRNTVGTATEIHDHLSLLFARIGEVFCPECERRVSPATPATVARASDEFPEETRYLITFPLDVRPDSNREALADLLRSTGFTRVRTQGRVVSLETGPLPAPDQGQEVVDVVVDRLKRGSENVARRLDSIETAFIKGFGRCRLIAEDGSAHTFFQGWRCSGCGGEFLSPDPRLFRYSSPLGACPTCQGFGQVVEPDLTRWRGSIICPSCHGARLRPEARAVKVQGIDIVALSARKIPRIAAFLSGINPRFGDHPVARQVVGQISRRLDTLCRIGLQELTLDRPLNHLAGGEAQRVKLTAALSSGLVNTLYVLDEPSSGLHSHDLGRLIAAIQQLRDAGNTVILIEHDPDMIRAADLIVDIGPGAGEAGGSIVFVEPPANLAAVAGSLTADYLNGKKSIPIPERRTAPDRGHLTIKGVRGNNLKNIDVAFPLNLLCVVTGVSGAGKSTLIEETLYPALRNRLKEESRPVKPFDDLATTRQIDAVILVDQTPIGRSGRSNPVTYLKAFDEIRKTFAATHESKLRNYSAARFSFNIEGGRCDACEGNGFLKIDMQFLPDVLVRCAECRGTRYRPETLEISYRGRNIAEVLDMTAREAFGYFRQRPKVQARLRPLLDLGLEYLRLGQPASTLSGGEAQRLKIANFISSSPGAITRNAGKSPTLFLFDEPTKGLHPSEIPKLIEALRSLLTLGHSLIVIEHAPHFIAAADWVIDLGPGAGDEGGQVVAEGTPETVAKAKTPTGTVLAGILGLGMNA